MKYYKTTWEHGDTNKDGEFPQIMFYEVPPDNYPQRIIEMFEDGRIAYLTERDVEIGEMPSKLEDLNDASLTTVEITAEEFFKIWKEEE